MAGRRGRPARASIHERLDVEVGELRARLGGLPLPAEAEDIWKTIWYEEAHNSTALEGNTLVLKEVEALLSEGRVLGKKQFRDYMEVRGYADAAQWVYGQAIAPGDWSPEQLLSIAEVREAHRRAMGPAWEADPHPDANEFESPGNWRQHNIHPFGGGMQPAAFTEVPALITDWVARVNSLRTDNYDGATEARAKDRASRPTTTVENVARLSAEVNKLMRSRVTWPWRDATPVGGNENEADERGRPIAERVADLHAQFERIHPFIDGNGRTGRLITNLVLVRMRYPPAIIYKRERPHYLDALKKADHGDTGPLGELFARAILDNLMRFILPAVAGPVRMVPLEALANQELSVAALRQAAERGRLRAQRTRSGTWQSSRQWVDAYKASRFGGLRARRGPRQPATQPREDTAGGGLDVSSRSDQGTRLKGVGDKIGDRIRRRRRELNLTQIELAARVGRQPAWISILEQGRRRPTADSLFDIARALSVPIGYLLGEEER